MSDLTDADRLAMLEHRVTELERRLYIGEHAFEPRRGPAPHYELAEEPGPRDDWAVIR